jgi:hypothetical protein
MIQTTEGRIQTFKPSNRDRKDKTYGKRVKTLGEWIQIVKVRIQT